VLLGISQKLVINLWMHRLSGGSRIGDDVVAKHGGKHRKRCVAKLMRCRVLDAALGLLDCISSISDDNRGVCVCLYTISGNVFERIDEIVNLRNIFAVLVYVG
jgi:hypothetical protein